MMKYFFTILLLSTALIYSQDTNPNVELPDFVIFGKDIISIRKVDKLKSDYISTVSNESLKPAYKPDYLELADVSNPVETELSLLDSANYRKGFFELKAGLYQLPAGELNYTFPYSGGMIHGFIKGLNQREYIDNSDKQYLEGSLDFTYSLPTNLSAMPGTKFSLSGDHTKNLFKFFGSIDPERKRNLNIGNASIGIQNLYMKEFIFDLNGGGDFTYLDNEKFNESLLYANAFGRLKLSTFSLGVKAAYQHQNLSTDSLSDSKKDAYYFRPTASLEIFKKIMLEAGFTFSASSGEKLNGLYASVSAEVAKNLILFGEYSPVGEIITAGKFLRNNFYYGQQDLNRVFLKKKNKLRTTLKYEFDKYYQIDGGIEFYDADNLPYYNNPDSSGFFEVLTSDASSWDFFLNMLYHLGPYGYFYGSVNYFNIQDPDSRKIPYYPGLKASLIYGYDFSKDWRGEIKFSYLSDRYADLENSDERKLPSIFDLGLKVSYTIQSNFGVFFELNNVFNTKRAIWEGYQEKPIDALIGINYFFD
ncbi:MAG: TonB-dependent receptor [Ignavibacteriaceae bacterium]|nr:TonB-dependent receptor [Ignavibacteriaceae bacterium]